MKILNLEDNVFKHHDICRALEGRGLGRIDMELIGNLEKGLEAIQNHLDQSEAYDLIITDMWYPEVEGGEDAASGEKFIQIAKEKGWKIPIILCSSIDYRFPEILGVVHYSEQEDWENELATLVKKLKK